MQGFKKTSWWKMFNINILLNFRIVYDNLTSLHVPSLYVGSQANESTVKIEDKIDEFER